MPAGIRPKGKAQKIKEAVMGIMPNEPRKKRSSKESKIKKQLNFEESARIK